MGNSIGGRIKELRLLQGMTQEKLADFVILPFHRLPDGNPGLCIRI